MHAPFGYRCREGCSPSIVRPALAANLRGGVASDADLSCRGKRESAILAKDKLSG